MLLGRVKSTQKDASRKHRKMQAREDTCTNVHRNIAAIYNIGGVERVY